MKTILLFTFSFLGFIVNSQTWSGEVASIFYNKCAKCHNPAGIAATPLTTFTEVSPLAAAIQSYVTDDEMPPWPPSKTYQAYQHDRSLTTSEKATILLGLDSERLKEMQLLRHRYLFFLLAHC